MTPEEKVEELVRERFNDFVSRLIDNLDLRSVGGSAYNDTTAVTRKELLLLLREART